MADFLLQMFKYRLFCLLITFKTGSSLSDFLCCEKAEFEVFFHLFLSYYLAAKGFPLLTLRRIVWDSKAETFFHITNYCGAKRPKNTAFNRNNFIKAV